MNATASKSIPLPCALLALSVAVCLGAAGPVQASSLGSVSTTKAEQRETIEHLLDVIQQAAKKLTERIDGQGAVLSPPHMAQADATVYLLASSGDQAKHRVSLLRDALLNLPPPTC